MPKRYRSGVSASVHEAMKDLHGAGLIDKTTMRKFDRSCLVDVQSPQPAQIVAIRNREKVSQSVFAKHLNVGVTLVSQWERGEKRPSGAAAKLISLVDRHGLSYVK